MVGWGLRRSGTGPKENVQMKLWQELEGSFLIGDDPAVGWYHPFRLAPEHPCYQEWCVWLDGPLVWMVRAFTMPGESPTARRARFIHTFYKWLSSVHKLEESYMSKHTKTSSISIDRWVNLPLTDEDKSILSEAVPTLGDIMSTFGALVFKGYRLSITWARYSSAIQASLVCVDAESPNAGIGVSGSDPDADMALITLLYKGTIMGTSPWTDYLTSVSKANWS